MKRRRTNDGHTKVQAKEDLHDVAMLVLLENDRRSTFVVDLEAESVSTSNPLRPVFYNQSMLSFPELQKAAREVGADKASQWSNQHPYTEFMHWATLRHDSADLVYSPAVFSNVSWDAITVRGRWNILSTSAGRRS